MIVFVAAHAARR